MVEARVQLLQRMPIFGGISTDVLEFLLTFCPVVSVPSDEFFFREDDQGDSLFVLDTGEATVLNSWHGEDHLIQIALGRWRSLTTVHAVLQSVPQKTALRYTFQLPTFIESTGGI